MRKLLLALAALCLTPPSSTQAHQKFHLIPGELKELDHRNTLSRVKTLSDADRRALTAAIANQLRPDLSDASKQELQKLAAESRVQFTDLNGDGIPEAIVQPTGEDLCGATGNCPFWIFIRSPTGFRLLFDPADEPSAQLFSIRSTKTNGYTDILLGLHDSASERQLTLYLFRAGLYHPVACYIANWQANISSEHLLRTPRIEPCRP